MQENHSPIASDQINVVKEGIDAMSVHDEEPDTKFLKLTPEQTIALASLRKAIAKDDSLSPVQQKWCTDATFVRYLRARQWNLDKAETMLRNTLKWRAEKKIDELRCETVASQIVMGHMYSHGFDKFDRPISVLRMHTELDPHDTEQRMLFMIHNMEHAIRRMDRSKGVDKLVWLVSGVGYNLKYNGDIGFARQLAALLQDHYPERLGMLIICDPPFIFSAMWKLVSPFIDESTRKKVLFCSGNARPKLLSETIDLAQVEKSFGGNDEFVFNGEAYLESLKAEDKEHFSS